MKRKSTASRKRTVIPVSEWMSRPVITAEATDTLAKIRRVMAERRINQLPVMDDGKLIGIVTDRDIRDAYPTSLVIDRSKEIDSFAQTYTVEEVMSHNVITVGASTPLAGAVRLLRRHRIGSLPVVQDGKLVGIITRSKILDFVLSGKSLMSPRAVNNKRRKPAKRSKK